jgi:hypothetical protein
VEYKDGWQGMTAFRIFSIIAALTMLLAAPPEATNWRIEKVSESDTGKWTSLKIDRNGNAHLAYIEENSLNLKYSFWDHAVKRWFTMNVSKGASFCSLALDSKERPHICYADYGSESGAKLRYAHWDGTSWKNEVIPLNAEVIILRVPRTERLQSH